MTIDSINALDTALIALHCFDHASNVSDLVSLDIPSTQYLLDKEKS